jgi:excisionase family DNA binding protein
MNNPISPSMKGVIIPMDRKELADMILSAVREAITEYRLEASEKAEPLEDIMNSRETAQFLDIKLNTLYIKTHRGELPFMKKGRKVYFSRKQLLEWMSEGRRIISKNDLKEADARLVDIRHRSTSLIKK